MTVSEVAKATGAHPNTTREHLEALVQAGELDRAQLPAVGRGRPPMIYRAIPKARDVGPEYRVLAEMLVRFMEQAWSDPDERRLHAVEAGRWWAERWGTGDRERLLRAAMFDAEPAPGIVPDADRPTLTFRVRRCPVLDVAREYPDVVCYAHLGILRAWVADQGMAEDLTLEPFAEVGACLMHVPVGALDAVPGMAAGLVECVPGAVHAASAGAAEDDHLCRELVGGCFTGPGSGAVRHARAADTGRLDGAGADLPSELEVGVVGASGPGALGPWG